MVLSFIISHYAMKSGSIAVSDVFLGVGIVAMVLSLMSLVLAFYRIKS